METPQTPTTPTSAAAGKPINPWMISTGVLGIALLAVLALQGTGLSSGGQTVSAEKAGSDLLTFINTIYGDRLGAATLNGTTEEHGLYRVLLTVNDETGQPTEQEVFVSRDGKLFIPQAIVVDEVLSQYQAFLDSQAAGGAGAEAGAVAGAETAEPIEVAPVE